VFRDPHLQIPHQQQDELLQRQQQNEERAALVKEERRKQTLGAEVGREAGDQKIKNKPKTTQKVAEAACH
jgi:hypothetical protein